MIEQWRNVPSFDGYIVSNLGRIRKARVGAAILKGSFDKDGYHRVCLHGCTLRVHVIVAEAYHGPRPAGLQIAHLDNNPRNNAADNLAYITPAENNSHKAIYGTHQDQTGERHPRAKLTDAVANEIKRRVADGETGRALGREFGISQSQVSRIASGKRRKASPKGSPVGSQIG